MDKFTQIIEKLKSHPGMISSIEKIKLHPGMSASVFLHFSLFIFLLLSFPQCQRKNPPEIIISVDLLPISKKTNIENKQATQKIKEEKPIAKPKPVEEAKPEAKEEPKPEAKPEPIPEPKLDKIPEKKPEVKKEPPKAKPKEKPAPKKEPAKEKKKTKPKVSEEDKLLKSLLADVAKTDSEEKVEKTSKGPTEVGMPLSMSVKDSIKRQIEQCWNPPAGNKDAASLKVLLDISFKQDGTVANVKIIDNSRYASDELYQVAADAAMRAVYKCSPLQDLPVDQYSMWKNLEFNFDPSDLIY